MTNSLVSSDNIYTYAAGLSQRKKILKDLRAALHEIRARPADIARWLPTFESFSTDESSHGKLPRSGFGSNKYEYPEMHITLHAKVSVFDSRRSLVSSMNVDPRSMYLNTEISLYIDDEKLAMHYSELHDALRKNNNSWVIAERSSRPWRSYAFWLFHLLGKLGIKQFWPYRYCTSYSASKADPAQTPDPFASDFHKLYEDDGPYPGIADTEDKVELFLVKHFSSIFQNVL